MVPELRERALSYSAAPMAAESPTRWPYAVPTCSIVICTRNRPAVLARCLAAVGRLAPSCGDVIVVDNGDEACSDEVLRLVASAGARLIREPRLGAAHARNVGAGAAVGELVAFLDDDARPDPDWLERHRAALVGDPLLSATTGRVLPDPPGDPVTRAYLAVGAEDLGTEPFRVERSLPEWVELTNFGGVGLGSNMVFRRELFAAGWRFRESLGPRRGLPGEEHYAFFTLVRDGHAIAYVPEAVVHHLAPPDMKSLEARKRRLLYGGAAYAFLLMIEEPEARRPLLAYARSVLSARRRSWRQAPATAVFASRRRRVAALALAPLAYTRWRIRWCSAHVPAIPRVPGPHRAPR